MDWANRWFLCRVCGQFIRTPSAFLKHKKEKCKGLNLGVRHFQNPDPLESGQQRSRSKGESKINLRPASGSRSERKLKCQLCNYSATFASDLKRHHIHNHSTEKTFVCKLCDYTCKTAGVLKSHSRYHAGETPFKCEECETSFNTRLSLGNHISRQHPIEDENQTQISNGTFVIVSAPGFRSQEFRCQLCKYSTARRGNMRNHIQTHTGVKPFVCKLCNYACTTRASLAGHRRFHAGETPFKCEDCPASFNNRLSLGHHVGRQHPVKDEYQPRNSKEGLRVGIASGSTSGKFQCQLCEHAAASVANLKDHIRTHTGSKPFVCEICKYACKQRSSLTLHRRYHAGETPFKCSECSATFNTQRSLAYHFARQHEERDADQMEPFTRTSPKRVSKVCRFCSKAFSSVSYREIHERIHTYERPFRCNKCSAKFNQKAHLKTHMVTHGETKCFRCKLCNFACNERKQLTVHDRIHFGKKPFACKMCNYTCKQLNDLKVHSRSHTGEKPYKCVLCNFASAQGSNLKKHCLRIHSEDKRFKCSSCDYATASSSYLNKHLKVHGVKASNVNIVVTLRD